MRLWHIFFGYTGGPAYRGQTTQGAAQRVYDFSVPQSIADLGSLDYVVNYTANGTENTGTNVIRLEFLPLSIEVSGTPLMTITSPPTGTLCVPDPGALSFDADSGGTLVLRKTSTGNGGGGMEVYVDGLGHGFTVHYVSLSPEYYTLEVGPGIHDLVVCHNDDWWPDNTGTRTEEIYFLPSTPIPTVSEWGLVVMTLLVLAAGTLVYTRRRTRQA